MTIELIPFNIFVVIMILVDLYVFNKKNEKSKIKKALLLTAFWIFLALSFNVGVYFWKGEKLAIEFFTAYLVEKSLSVDNLFFFLIIFDYFKIPNQYQHKVLIWGVVGAIIFRALFITLGIALIAKFHFLFYIFGAFLIIIGLKALFSRDRNIHPENNPILKILKKYVPITNELHDEKFIIRQKINQEGKKGSTYRWMATPLLVVLVMIEATDIVFAVDSIPAVLAITQDPFIAYTSNIFAVLGLRALYFSIAHLIPKFIYLHTAIALILTFVGFKMVVINHVKIPTVLSLSIIVVLLASSIIASLIHANIGKNKK
jgi:tellurite resistance protein TerC